MTSPANREQILSMLYSRNLQEQATDAMPLQWVLTSLLFNSPVLQFYVIARHAEAPGNVISYGVADVCLLKL